MKDKLIRLVEQLQQRKLMVIGDVVADVYLEGKISRISREAPVLVLEHTGETVVPGGAANVVHNAATLGGEVFAVGVVGEDQPGRVLSQILRQKGVHTDGFLTESPRPTVTKTRVMAGGQATVRQQVVRIDREDKLPLSGTLEQKIVDYIQQHITKMDAVVLSDYGSFTVSPLIRTTVISACRQHGIPCIVDSRYNITDFTGVNFVKQNEAEAAAAVGFSLDDDEAIQRAGNELLTRLQADAVLITRGSEGMTLVEQGGIASHIPVTNISEVYDVSGAGDTVVATMMLAVAAGASRLEAAQLANYAAGVVVRKLGTATSTPQELKQAIGETR
ncbi:carbohydrate kinase [Anaerosporomusa subterranea]|uniref:Carbohydrate kinase n=1 Tax=Anaerosporomusa subterranea TaxID=1794912 RepID=A0A154BVW2_ANASB|nr:PfkB family carbohydrate kinase [Anaerosporomusa subterranea]KYZ78057.1 carbohydrate kinase [Anaerosporomusa subterranea]